MQEVPAGVDLSVLDKTCPPHLQQQDYKATELSPKIATTSLVLSVEWAVQWAGAMGCNLFGGKISGYTTTPIVVLILRCTNCFIMAITLTHYELFYHSFSKILVHEQFLYL